MSETLLSTVNSMHWSMLIPCSRLDLDDIHGTCEHNSNVAKKFGRKDLVTVSLVLM